MDCCQDKTSPYDIRTEDQPLIEAAISLGENLLRFPDVTAPERLAISAVLDFLKKLPAPPVAGLHADFGFAFWPENDSPNPGHVGSWSVGVCRAMFEIFNCGRDELPEFSWLLCPGQENHNHLTYSQDWIAQVSDRRSLDVPGYRFTIEASTWSVKD